MILIEYRYLCEHDSFWVELFFTSAQGQKKIDNEEKTRNTPNKEFRRVAMF